MNDDEQTGHPEDSQNAAEQIWSPADSPFVSWDIRSSGPGSRVWGVFRLDELFTPWTVARLAEAEHQRLMAPDISDSDTDEAAANRYGIHPYAIAMLCMEAYPFRVGDGWSLLFGDIAEWEVAFPGWVRLDLFPWKALSGDDGGSAECARRTGERRTPRG